MHVATLYHKILARPRITQIIDVIPNYDTFLDLDSPLLYQLAKHVRDKKCRDCRRFISYHLPEIVNQSGVRQHNNYPHKPRYPSCRVGIELFKNFFASAVNNIEGLVVSKARHSNAIAVGSWEETLVPLVMETTEDALLLEP